MAEPCTHGPEWRCIKCDPLLAQVVKLGEERDAARAEAAQLREQLSRLTTATQAYLEAKPPMPVCYRAEAENNLLDVLGRGRPGPGGGRMTGVDYSSPVVPEAYTCSACGAHGCKLWREYSTFAPLLFCAPCAGERQSVDISEIDDDGKIPFEKRWRTDSIGWYVPAVPDEEGEGFWGYGSVPPEGVAWWRGLPTLLGVRA